MTDQSYRLQSLLDSLGVTLTLAFLGYQPEADKPADKRWPHFSWRVTLTRNGESYSSDYRTGVGHAKPMPPNKALGKVDSRAEYEWYNSPRNWNVPASVDIVYSLMSDAQCGQDTFEDFCGSLGYDTDSRKAFDTYLACQGALNGMRRLFREHFDDVVKAIQDY